MHIFKVTESTTRLKFEIFGLKLKIQLNSRPRIIKKFIQHKVAENTVLLAELNFCHWETLPGYCKILQDLGYNVEILIVNHQQSAFCRFENKPKIWVLRQAEAFAVLQDKSLNKYKHLVINSKVIYDWHSIDYTDIKKLLANLSSGQKDTVYVQHQIEFLDKTPEDKQIILANPADNPKLDKCVVNPHYFGKINLTEKSEHITNFITVGELSEKRRNSKILVDAVKFLHASGIHNFKVTVIGRGELNQLEPDIQKYFDILGRLDFPEMYQALEQADFFLPLLDPEISAHERYMKDGTSGSFQLIYGFLKPCLIHKTFADIYDFNENDALIYQDNSELPLTMQKACELSSDDYLKMQKHLNNKVSDIEQISLNNLRELLNE